MPPLALENITNSTSFLSLRSKMRSLVSSSPTLTLLLVKISQISLLWLLFLPVEDQMCGTHANQDMMWHIVKWASIMHTSSSRESASPNASYFSLPLSHGSFCRMWQEKQHLTVVTLTGRQGQGEDRENELMRWPGVLRFLSSHIVYSSVQHIHDTQNSYCCHLQEELLKQFCLFTYQLPYGVFFIIV